MMQQKSPELERIIEEFRSFLQTNTAKSHIDYLKNKEPKETKEILEKLRSINNTEEFVDLVLYGLLPNAQSKYAKRVSLTPAFMNIKKFFSRFNYTEDDWRNIASLVFDTIDEFDRNPDRLKEIIKKFVSNKYSKALQCGSITPILHALNPGFPIVNNRTIRTFRTLSRIVFGKEDEIYQQLEYYPENIEKIKKFVSILSKDHGLKEIEDYAIFDLFCYWFDEQSKSRKVEEPKEPVKKLREEDKMFEPTEEEEVIAIPEEKKKVIWQPKDYSVRELYEMYKDGDLDPRPKFQRFFVWDDKKSSRLIESILLEVPIPNIYLAEDDNGKLSVIDGQQRLTALIDFIDGKLKLRGLLVLNELNGKKFSDIEHELKSKFKKSTIHTILIKKESHRDIRFEIFERLNTGSVKLNDQELRNCIYRGAYNDFIAELSENKDFLFLLGLKKPHKRMLDRELILRFFAFYNSTYLKYEPPMKSFLNNEIESKPDIDERKKSELERVFKKSVELTKETFGENAFKRFIIGNEVDRNGYWESRINKALFDVVMYGFTQYEKNQIYPKKDAIKEELVWLMTHDEKFIDSITISTNDKPKVLERFEIWMRALRDIVGQPHKEPRSFSYEIKEQLFKANQYCGICGQKILFLDDAEVHHIDFYWRGGKTIPSNARLVHRFCNRSIGKGN